MMTLSDAAHRVLMWEAFIFSAHMSVSIVHGSILKPVPSLLRGAYVSSSLGVALPRDAGVLATLCSQTLLFLTPPSLKTLSSCDM